ncbi:MAG: hypothetical protein ACLTK4_05765 [Roseburia intestinalis]
MNKAVAAFRQDHGRGIMIHVTSQRAEDGLRVVIRKTPRTSVRGGKASRPPVVSLSQKKNRDGSGDARSNVEQQDKKKSMKKCVVDIRYHAAVGNYSRILVVLTSHQERKMEETKEVG